jgi:phage host-nuclease inhibitor protein Gam
LEGRVENLEKLVAVLEPLPHDVRRLGDRMDRVETEVVRLRTDMNDGFSTVREEMAEHARETAGHILETQRQVTDVQRQLTETQLQVIDTQRQMRVLHEDVIERISRIGKG